MKTKMQAQLIGAPITLKQIDNCWWKHWMHGYPNADVCWRVDVGSCKLQQKDDPRLAQMSFSPITGPRISGKTLRRLMWSLHDREYIARTVVLVAGCGNAECINPDHAVMKEKQAAIHAKKRSESKKAVYARMALKDPFIDVLERHKSDGEWLSRFLVLAVWLEHGVFSPSNMTVVKMQMSLIPYIWPDFTLEDDECEILAEIPIRGDARRYPDLEGSVLLEILPLTSARSVYDMIQPKYGNMLLTLWGQVAPGAYDSLNMAPLVQAWEMVQDGEA